MSFGISLSGLDAASSSLDVIGNNISNSNTVGFKSSRSNFADVYAAGSLNLNANQIGEGVQVQSVQQEFGQGSITQTGNNLDLALNGNGFFVLKDSTGTSYSRNGTFSIDKNGYLVNGSAQQVQAFPAVAGAAGGFNTGSPGPLQISSTLNTPQATTTGKVGVNLPANSPIPGVAFNNTLPSTYNSTTSTTIYDSLGTQHTASFYFVPTAAAAGAAATWNVYLAVDGTTVDQANPGTLSFSSSGALTAPAGGNLNFTTGALPDGAAPLNMNFNFSQTTQFGSPFSVNSVTQNGYSSGQLSGINIDASGIVSASYSNGQSLQVAQLALANFPDPTALAPVGNSNWKETVASGAALAGVAGSSSLGAIQSGALESSNVNLTSELVQMIVSQRAYQANAQVITTNDQITQTVLQIATNG